MMRLTFLVMCLGLVPAALSAAETNSPAPSRPHIVFFLIDDMGYADAGFLGGREIQTPHMNELAQAGAVLESFYVQPVCSPTRSCLMTGRYVAHTGVYNIVKPDAKWGLPLEERTLPGALREAGYETAIVGKWHLGEFQNAYRPLQRGFDHQYGNWLGAIDYNTHKRGNVFDWHRDDQLCHDRGYSTNLVAQEACRIIKDRKEEKPLFLYVPFNGVHAPYMAPKKYLKPYGRLPGQRRTYAGMLAAVDEAIGQVVAALKEKKMFEQTLILFSSDNGGPAPGRITDNGPLRAGKGTIYEGGVRACAFAAWPGHIPAGRINEPLHMVDWYPTLLGLAGGSLNQKMPLDGKDIWPVITAGAGSPHDYLLLCGTTPQRAAIRAGEWKLLLNASAKDAEQGDDDAPSGNVELYNVVTDMGEKKNVAAANPEKVKELRTKLAEYQKTFVPPGGARR